MPHSKLDQALIVDEALAILRSKGLSQVTLRNLAATLDVRVSSLYWHVKDKDALCALMSESIFRACLRAVPPASKWDEWLLYFGRALWQSQSAIPDARQLIASSSMDSDVRRELIDEILSTLDDLGLDRKVGAIANRSVQALVTGWTTLPSIAGVSGAEERNFECALSVLIAGWRGYQPDTT